MPQQVSNGPFASEGSLLGKKTRNETVQSCTKICEACSLINWILTIFDMLLRLVD